MQKEKIEVGSIVRVKGHDINMKVISIDDTNALVSWYDAAGGVHMNPVAIERLTLVEPKDPMALVLFMCAVSVCILAFFILLAYHFHVLGYLGAFITALTALSVYLIRRTKNK